MTNDKQEIIDSINDTEETVNDEIDLDFEVDDTEETNDIEEVDVEAIKKENATLKAQKEHWKKKATAGKQSVTETKTESNDLSQTELVAIIRANISDEDIDTVKETARILKIPVNEALKSDVLKTILEKREQARKTAQATNTGTTRKSNAQVSDDVLRDNARKGILPDSDAELERLLASKWKKN